LTVFEIVADVAGRLESIGVPYVIGGSLASSTWGQMRSSNDADLAIRASKDHLQRLIESFQEPYHLDKEELTEALSANTPYRMVQLIHMDEAFKIDLYLLGEGEYDLSEFERARNVEVFPGVVMRFAAPENIILEKLRWFELGNRVSDRQWSDVVEVLESQKGRLDEEYLNKWAAHFQIAEHLNKARGQVQ
jgi:hypothetical protein